MSKKKQPKNKSCADIVMGQRGSWGAVNPVTKVIPDKRHNKPKYKNKEEAE